MKEMSDMNIEENGRNGREKEIATILHSYAMHSLVGESKIKKAIEYDGWEQMRLC